MGLSKPWDAAPRRLVPPQAARPGVDRREPRGGPEPPPAVSSPVVQGSAGPSAAVVRWRAAAGEGVVHHWAQRSTIGAPKFPRVAMVHGLQQQGWPRLGQALLKRMAQAWSSRHHGPACMHQPVNQQNRCQVRGRVMSHLICVLSSVVYWIGGHFGHRLRQLLAQR